MALTQTAEYALRAVVWLAQHPGEPQTKNQIAAATQVPSSYLPKVFQPLVRGGLIAGQRGIGGGYSLVRDPAEISLLDVVNQVDPIQRIETCPLDLSSHGTKLCPLHSLLNQVIVGEERRLAETKVADVMGGPGRLSPLCEVARRLAEATNGADAGTGDDEPVSPTAERAPDPTTGAPNGST